MKKEDRYIDGKDELIAEIAARARFTKSDVKLILDTLIKILIEAVKS